MIMDYDDYYASQNKKPPSREAKPKEDN